jgi:hypothetical protein
LTAGHWDYFRVARDTLGAAVTGHIQMYDFGDYTLLWTGKWGHELCLAGGRSTGRDETRFTNGKSQKGRAIQIAND